MNTFQHKFFLLLSSILLLASAFLSCSDDVKDPSSNSGNLSDLGGLYNNISTNWGSTKDEVRKKMTKFEELPTTSDDILVFTESDNNLLGYSFKNNRLAATSFIIKNNEPEKDYSLIFDKFNYLADSNQTKIYYNLTSNTLGTYQQSFAGSDITVIGYAPIKSDLYEYVEPLGVKTLDVSDIRPFKATFKATISAYKDKSVEAGFYIGFSPRFEDNTYRKVIGSTTGNLQMEINGLYGEQTYYYQAYAIIDKVEYKGEVKSFESKPISYFINGQECQFILVEGGPYGDFYMFETEIPAGLTINIADSDISLTPRSDGTFTSYNYRTFFSNLNKLTGLPVRNATSDEWKLAFHGGVKSHGYTYSGSDNIDQVAWYKENSGYEAHPAKEKSPNELGLYDMSGNYAEIYSDTGTEYFKNHVYLTYAHFNGATKALGGYWGSDAEECTPYSQLGVFTSKDIFDGKRVALRIVFNIDPAAE